VWAAGTRLGNLSLNADGAVSMDAYADLASK
jgi:hypothetical protein